MKYPIGIQDFEYLRNWGFAYVDRTRFVYELADTGKYYFLGRPRRFGKSLLVTTMEANLCKIHSQDLPIFREKAVILRNESKRGRIRIWRSYNESQED